MRRQFGFVAMVALLVFDEEVREIQTSLVYTLSWEGQLTCRTQPHSF